MGTSTVHINKNEWPSMTESLWNVGHKPHINIADCPERLWS